MQSEVENKERLEWDCYEKALAFEEPQERLVTACSNLTRGVISSEHSEEIRAPRMGFEPMLPKELA